MQYLTAQTCQLRDANETRLRIYEALEQSVAELERNNRSLQDEGKTDKKRIKAYVSYFAYNILYPCYPCYT